MNFLNSLLWCLEFLGVDFGLVFWGLEILWFLVGNEGRDEVELVYND